MDLLKTKMSLRYTSEKSDRPLSTSYINLWKVLGALVSPNGITLNSNNPYLHANATRCWCSRAMQIWWYLHYKSRLLKIQCPFRWLSRLSMRGKGYLSKLVLAFSALKSTHNHKLPSFLWANKTGCPMGEVDGAIHPFSSMLSTFFLSLFSSG